MSVRVRVLLAGIALGLATALTLGATTGGAAGRYQIAVTFDPATSSVVFARIDTQTGQVEAFRRPQALPTAPIRVGSAQ